MSRKSILEREKLPQELEVNFKIIFRWQMMSQKTGLTNIHRQRDRQGKRIER